MRRLAVRVAVPGLLSAVTSIAAVAQQQAETRRPAQPVEPIAAIIAAFGQHRIVAIPDAHGNQQAHSFLLSLIRDPRFAATVDVIVYAIGSARHQAIMDEFVQGEEVPYPSLRLTWSNTTLENVEPDLASHEEVAQAVREVNASLSSDHHLRLLLADPPIDWAVVKGPADVKKWRDMRPGYVAALIQMEVIAKDQRALLVYPLHQLQRRSVFSNYDMQDWRMQTPISVIESTTPERLFTIWPVTDSTLGTLPSGVPWRVPSLAVIRGTVLGTVDFTRYFWSPPRFTLREGAAVPVPREEWRTLRAEEQFDAVLYLGPSSTMTRVPFARAVCSEPGYLEMRLERMALAGVPRPEMDRLRQHCAPTRRDRRLPSGLDRHRE